MSESPHQSIKPEPEILSHYCGSHVKYYYLPLHESGPVNKIVAKLLGCYNYELRSEDQIRRSVTKAVKGRYSAVKIPVDRPHDFLIDRALQICAEYGISVVLQIFISSLHSDEFCAYLKNQNLCSEVEFVVEHNIEDTKNRLEEFAALFNKSHLSIPVFKTMDWSLIYCPYFFDVFRNIHLYFGYNQSSESEYLSCVQAHRLVGMLRQRFTKNLFLPPKGVDLWDDRAHHELDMEPYILPCYRTVSANPNIKYSVIIPAYNNESYIPTVLENLYHQDVGLDNFEVILVDDGGVDRTQYFVINLLKSLPRPMNLKYIYFPRARPRERGDAQYRSGIARNLGAKNAEGDTFCFLDSDIVVPTDYLTRVGKALLEWDAVQARRFNLSHRVSARPGLRYSDVDENKDLIPDEPYWEEFNKMTNWHKINYNWKYVCTHSFSIKRKLFWELGGLKKNYIYYGFEDTDLGYRLVKFGYKLYLLDLNVYHLYHTDLGSEFFNIKALRHSLLSRTAQIFYLNHLDEDIFENLLGFMESQGTLQENIKNIFKVISLSFVREKKLTVYSSLENCR